VVLDEQVSTAASTVFWRDLNAHVGTDTEACKAVIERLAVSSLNKKVSLCCSSVVATLFIINNFYQHRCLQVWMLEMVFTEKSIS